MPSFLGRIFGISFRTELLIMNIFGLVNSTLDWSPLKWTNKLEQIWNLSIPQKSLIVDTIGEDTIKTILSWIVITRIVIAHVYTFTYLSNIYPIITWSRPNLLLPWLILSFFKNVVLEVVVIVIGLLLWYGSPFSLVVFLEFIFVKLVPLVLASYNWYSNSCLFLQLRQIEKMRKLNRSMRSDSNLLTNQLYVKIDDPKYRTGSLTTLFSFDSYETYNARMTPGQNAKKLLGITEQDVKDAQARIKERETHKRLTELDDDSDLGIGGREASIPYYFSNNIYEDDSFMSPITPRNPTNLKKLKELENTEQITSENPEENKDFEVDGTAKKKSPEETKNSEADDYLEKKNNPKTDQVPGSKKEAHENIEKIEGLKMIKAAEGLKNVGEVTTTEVLARKKIEEPEITENQKTKLQRTCSSCQIRDTRTTTSRKEVTGLSPTRQPVKNSEKSPSPMKLQALFSCDCPLEDIVFKGDHADCCKTMDMRTSTPRSDLGDDNKKQGPEENSKKSVDQSYTYAYNVTNMKTDFTMNSGFPLIEKLLENDLEILKSVKMEDENDQKGFVEDLSTREVQKIEEEIEMEKKWNLFAGQTNLETLLSVAFSRKGYEIDGSPSSAKIIHPLINDPLKFEKMLDTSGSSFQSSDHKEDNSIPSKIQGDYQFCSKTPLRVENIRQPVAVRTTRSVHTQTQETIISGDSNRSLMDVRPHRKYFFRRKRSKNQNGSVSPVNSNRQHSTIKNSRSSFFKSKSNAPVSPKSLSSDSKKRSLSKSSSNKSICECKPQKLKAKYYPSTDSSLNKLEENCKLHMNPKIDSLATLPLAQVTHQPEVNPTAFKKKPPVYPKKTKKELQAVVSHETPKKLILSRKIEVETKKSVDKQSMHNPKTTKPRNRRKMVTEEQAARELKALKAYNEITLLKDKKELEAKKRTPIKEPSNRTEEFRSFYKKTNPRNDMGKENLLADTTTETVASLSSSSRSIRSAMNAAGRPISDSSDKSSYSKTNKVKNRALEHFDRLYVSQTTKDNARDRLVADLYSKKEYMNYSLSQIRQIADVVTGSPSSSMKLEGAQKGRDLDRTEAKEDVRNRISSVDVDTAQLEVRLEEQGRGNVEPLVTDSDWDKSGMEIGNIETGDKELLTLVKKLVKEDVSSNWSSSSIDQEEEGSAGVTAESSNAKSQVQDLPKVEEEGAEIPEDLRSTASIRSSRSDQIMESVKEEMVQQKADTSHDHQKPQRPDIVDFIRNIEVTSQGNGVILTNPNVPPSTDDRIPVQWDIVDSKTAIRLHNALSYKSMDSLVDIAGEIRTVEEILLDSWTESSHNESIDVFTDQFPPIPQHSSRVNNISATIQGATDTNQLPGPLDLCIITIDRTNLINNLEVENIVGNQEPVLSETQLDDVLRSVAEVLRSLNIGEFDLEIFNRSRFEILQDMIHGTEGQIIEDLQRNTIDDKEDEEDDEEILKEIEEIEEIPRFIKEDIFTDIKFPVVIKRTEVDPNLLKIFHDPSLGLHSSQVVRFVEPVELNFCGLTEVMEEDEEEAEEAAGSLRKDSNLKKVSFARDAGLLSTYFNTEDTSFHRNEDSLDNDELSVEEYQSAVDEILDASLDSEYISILETPEFSESALRRLMKENLNVTYDIIEVESLNEDVEMDEVDIVEMDESVNEEDKMKTWRIREIDEAGNSFESEEVGECSEMVNDENEARYTELEKSIICASIDVEEPYDSEKLGESIEVEEIIDEKVQERVQDEELEEIVEENVDEDEINYIAEAENIEKMNEAEKFIKIPSKITCPEKQIETRKLKEMICQGKEEVEEESTEDTDRTTEERKLEDTVTFTKNKTLDKHEKEEDIKTENFGEYICINEDENVVKEEEIRSNIESVQVTTNVDSTDEKEETLQVLSPYWIKSDIIIDYPEETEEDTCEENETSTEEKKEVLIPETDQEENLTELKEEMSIMTILIFWLMVFYFYIRYFYRKMFSFTQISRATSALKPFDVHTVSTSTSTLLEKASLLNKIQDGTLSEDAEELYESSVDFETMNISRAIEERLKVVLDLTAERSTSRNSEFGTEEMAEELKREIEELGLNASGCIEKTSLLSNTDEESLKKKSLSVSKLEEKINLQVAEEIRTFRFEEPGQPSSSSTLLQDDVSSEDTGVHEATVKIEKHMEEIGKSIIMKELSLVIEESKEEKSLRDERATNEEVVEEKISKIENNEEAKSSIENSEDSPVQFQTTLNELDSFDSLYTRPSVTSNTISFSKLDADDMEEFSAASSTSDKTT